MSDDAVPFRRRSQARCPPYDADARRDRIERSQHPRSRPKAHPLAPTRLPIRTSSLRLSLHQLCTLPPSPMRLHTVRTPPIALVSPSSDAQSSPDIHTQITCSPLARHQTRSGSKTATAPELRRLNPRAACSLVSPVLACHAAPSSRSSPTAPLAHPTTAHPSRDPTALRR
ncbi:hypothetical protein C8Q80DRAFT_776214 [Daedaleopsis nitida]|nr:hypothetical protein C8Q80DRAFT_775641 [Daedaleopsis nitida]KAI0746520.1 hypothetical protein C8Q80DRAFT_776214 [Daedaleopsis nitida]